MRRILPNVVMFVLLARAPPKPLSLAASLRLPKMSVRMSSASFTKTSSPPVKSNAIPPQEIVLAVLMQLETRLATASARAQVLIARLVVRVARAERTAIKGLYLYGEVGRGKTMLMDLFFEDESGPAQAARAFPRIHGDVHERVHSTGKSSSAAKSKATIRLRRSPPPLRRKHGCFALTNFMSPTLPTP